VADLRGELKAPKREHRAALPAAEMPGFLPRREACEGHIQTRPAPKFLALSFVRSLELRGPDWRELVLEHAEWRMSAERMMRAPHIVPLSNQVLAAEG
jgi:integrase